MVKSEQFIGEMISLQLGKPVPYNWHGFKIVV